MSPVTWLNQKRRNGNNIMFIISEISTPQQNNKHLRAVYSPGGPIKYRNHIIHKLTVQESYYIRTKFMAVQYF